MTPSKLSGKEIASLMRKHKVTIRELSQRTGFTIKRIRQVRASGLDNRGVIRDWLQGITGEDPEAQRLHIPPAPCTSCPYRRDTPPGVWHPDEYEKLRGYDDPQTSYSTFLCHHSTEAGRDAVCRGWLSVHRESIAARLAVSNGTVPDEARYEELADPLYASGNEAADAGMRGVKRPSKAAQKVIERLSKRKQS